MGAPVVLIGVEWTLVHLRRDGALVEPPDGASEVVLRFSADGQMSGTDGCNFFFGGPVVISGARLAVGRIGTTLVGCPGIVDFTTAVGAVLHGEVDWTVLDGVLTISAADGDALVYERRRSIYPSDRPGRPAPHVLAEGAHGAGDYRLFYTAFDDRVSLAMEYRDAPGEGWAFWGTTMERGWSGPEPYPMSTAQCQVAGERFVAGMVTNAVARVMFRPLGGADPVDLPVYPLADAPDVRAYGGFVGDPRRGSDVVAYDADGSRLGPPYTPHWWLPGDPI